MRVKQIHTSSKNDIEGLLPESDHVLAVTSSLGLPECLGQQIKTLEQAVSKRLKHTPAYEQC